MERLFRTDVSADFRYINLRAPSSGLWWERMQKKLPPGVAIGAVQLYFDDSMTKPFRNKIRE